ncbi:hypothetical protein DPPLL_00160 [Desulfofustis limnaeus]|uniref:Uncharacterized protein n=1 Tax=Desulfofustis limnaeus TaxID=2740163 RepID=A0ABN6LYH3_9BACT|nr:hypothetical protein DPPLL_00160 [Desulfofustis limnaeus]
MYDHHDAPMAKCLGELEKFEISCKIEARKIILPKHIFDIPRIKCDCATMRLDEMTIFQGSR